jgi:hypothetical protein
MRDQSSPLQRTLPSFLLSAVALAAAVGATGASAVTAGAGAFAVAGAE